MFQLLYSNDNKSIRDAIFQRLNALNSSGKEVYIVVPEMFTYSSELQIMDCLELESMISIKVISFQRMTDIVLTQEGGIKRQKIDDVGKALIIRKLMNEEPEKFKLYKGMIDKDGFYTKLIAIIKDFKNNQISSSEIQSLKESCKTDLLKEKLNEIQLIYNGLESYLINKYVDNEDRLNQLLETLDDSNIFKDKEIFFWQFSKFSQLEYNILNSLSRMGANITFSLIYDQDENSNCFDVTKSTRSKILDIANENNIHFVEYFLKQLQCAPKYKYINGSTTADEINLVARQVRLLLDSDVSYDEIALIYSMEEYGELVKRVFEEYNIHVLINNKESLMTTAVASWIKNMLNVVITGFRYEEVISFLKSSLNAFSLDEVQVFENYVLRKNIRGDMYLRDKYFKEDFFISTGEQESVNKIRIYLEQGFKGLKPLVRKELPLMTLVEVFFDALNEFRFVEMIDKLLEQLEEENLFKEIEIVEQSYVALVDIIDQMAEIAGNESISLFAFANLIESGFKQKKLGAIPEGNKQILLSSVNEGLSGDYKWIFFFGANSEYMPRAKKQQALLSEKELDEISGEIAGISTRKVLDIEESHNLYKLLTMATECFVFSFSSIGLDGRRQKPSVYIKNYKATALDIKESWEFRLDPMLYELSDIIREYVEYGRITEKDLLLLASAKKTMVIEDKVKIILKNDSLDKDDFNIDSIRTRLIYPEPLELSITRIQHMTRCEFAHFIKYGISPKERDIATMEPKEIGTLLHGFVEDFAKEVKENPKLIDMKNEGEIKALVDKLYQEKIESLLDKEALDSYRNIYLLGKLKRSAFTLGKLMIEQVRTSEFTLFGQEIYFGKNGEFAQVDLSGAEYNASVKGYIDRVDILEHEGKSYVKVIDYKSGGKVFSLSDSYNGLDIQLVFYLAAVLGDNKNALPGGAFYYPLIEKQIALEDDEKSNLDEKRRESYKMDGIAIADKEILEKMDSIFESKNSSLKLKGRGSLEEKTNLLSQSEFKGLIDHVKKEAKLQLDNLFAGQVRINPYLKENTDIGCKFCNYKAICGLDSKLDKARFKKLVEFDVESIKRKLGGEG